MSTPYNGPQPTGGPVPQGQQYGYGYPPLTPSPPKKTGGFKSWWWKAALVIIGLLILVSTCGPQDPTPGPPVPSNGAVAPTVTTGPTTPAPAPTTEAPAPAPTTKEPTKEPTKAPETQEPAAFAPDSAKDVTKKLDKEFDLSCDWEDATQGGDDIYEAKQCATEGLFVAYSENPVFFELFLEEIGGQGLDGVDYVLGDNWFVATLNGYPTADEIKEQLGGKTGTVGESI